jgi:hypothetical protein
MCVHNCRILPYDALVFYQICLSIRLKSHNSNLNHDFSFLVHFTCNDSVSCSLTYAEIGFGIYTSFFSERCLKSTSDAMREYKRPRMKALMGLYNNFFSLFLLSQSLTEGKVTHSESVPLIVLIR